MHEFGLDRALDVGPCAASAVDLVSGLVAGVDDVLGVLGVFRELRAFGVLGEFRELGVISVLGEFDLLAFGARCLGPLGTGAAPSAGGSWWFISPIVIV